MNNDDELKSVLRSADPAASLSPLDPSQFHSLKGAIMTDTTTPAPARRKRAPLIWGLVGGAAALAIVGAFVIPTLTAGPEPVTVFAAPVVDPMATSLKCAEPTVELMQTATVAFEATATSVKGGDVSLDVSNVFKGEITDKVQVLQGNPEISDGGGVMYEAGTTYLLASDGENIWSCGLSGPKTAELEALYTSSYTK